MLFTFGKTAEAAAVNSSLVDKYFSAPIIRGNEAISLLIVPPLTGSCCLCHDSKI